MDHKNFFNRYLFNFESKLVLGSLLLISAVMLFSSSMIGMTTQRDLSIRGMLSNPAAVYCEEMGFTYETETTEAGQKGVCRFGDTDSCSAWKFLEGSCGQEYSYCAQQGYGVETKHDGKNSFLPSYAVCVSETGEEVGSVTELVGLTEKSLGCQGTLDETTKEDINLDGTFTAAGDFLPPTSFDWRNTGPYIDKNWLTPVRDQGQCGSCWAFAAVGVTEAAYNIEADNPSLDPDLSEQYLVSDCDYNSGDCCGGWTDSALSYIRDYGVPDEGCLGYVDGNPSTGCSCSGGTCDANCVNSSFGCSDTTCSDRCGDWESRLQHITDVYAVNSDLTSLKQALIDHGPLAVSLDMGGYYDGDVFRCSIEDGYTNHAVAIVGYDDAGSYWIVRNSWGTGYEDGGYFKVGYGECSIEQYAYFPAYDSAVTGPANDDMASAIDISPASLPYTNTQDTNGATLEEGEPYPTCADGVASVWYTFTPTSAGLYEVDTLGSGYDTVLNVYEDLGGGSYFSITCNDQEDINYSDQSRTVFWGEVGTTYYIGVTEWEYGAIESGPGVPGTGRELDDRSQDRLTSDKTQAGGALTLNLQSFSCPSNSLCVIAKNYYGSPLEYPVLYAYTTGGELVDLIYSSSTGYVQMDFLSPGTYDVEVIGNGAFMYETGWSLGYHEISAESLSAVDIYALDISGDPTISGDVYLKRTGSEGYGEFVGWYYEGPGSAATVYLTPGTYDVEIKDWWDGDYLLAMSGQSLPGSGTAVLDASQMGVDTVTLSWDAGFDSAYSPIPGMTNYAYYFWLYSSPHTIYINNGQSSYGINGIFNTYDGADSWTYYLYNGCQITGSPGAVVSCPFGGTFTISLDALGAPYVPGETGVLEAEMQDGYGNDLVYLEMYDADGVYQPAPSTEPVHPDPRNARVTEDPLSGEGLQGIIVDVYPVYEVYDALGGLIPGAPFDYFFDSPYEFDIPDPANEGSWEGVVTLDLGPYQTDITDTVNFEVFEHPSSLPATDFDGDGISDPAKFYSSTGTAWWLESSTDSWESAWLGSGAFDYVPYSDFDGDGMTDPGKFTAADGTVWYIKSSTSAWEGKFLGVDPYTYVAGNDFDGDGKTDPTKLLANGAIWYPQSSTGVWEGFWVGPEDFEYVAGSDFDGDGETDPAKFIADPGVLWYYQSTTSSWVGVFLGSDAYDYVSASDFDGDGKTDPAKFYAGTDTVWWLQSTTGTWDAAWLGAGSYTFVGGNDFDGDGVTDPAKYDPAAGTLSWLGSSTGTWDSADLGTDSYELVN